MNMLLTKNIKITTLILFIIITLLPLSNLIFSFTPATHLHGVTLPQNMTTLSYENLRDEKYQKFLSDWLMKKSALWSWSVKISNQIFYSFFNQVSPGFNGSILTNDDGSFFQPMYLRSFNRSKTLNENNYKKFIPNLEKLNVLLAERGIKLVILISTNKISIYPEEVSTKFINPNRLKFKNSYDLLKSRLSSSKLSIIDMHERISKLDPKIGFYGEGKSFSYTASHWNDVTSCEATNDILNYTNLKQVIGEKILPCNNFIMINPPPREDLDLLEIANLLYPENTYRASPSVVYQDNKNILEKEKPKVLLIGTSFLFSIQNHLEKSNLIKSSKLFFYYRDFRDKYLEKFQKLDKKKIDWERDVLSNDVVVLEINQASIGKLGYGFVKDAIKYLEKKNKKETQD